MIPNLDPDDIRPYLNIESLIPTAEAAFHAISEGAAQAPAWLYPVTSQIRSGFDCPLQVGDGSIGQPKYRYCGLSVFIYMDR